MYFTILVVVRRFPSMGAADSRSLRSDSYVRMQDFVRRSTCVPFRLFWGDVRREFMQSLSAALHGTISATLFRRAMLTRWHAFLFLGLRFSPSFLLFAWCPPARSLLFLVKIFLWMLKSPMFQCPLVHHSIRFGTTKATSRFGNSMFGKH
jgi:hypothetical protein